MTQPTIEQMIEFLGQEIKLERSMAGKAPSGAYHMFIAIRTALTAQSANMLPLEEVPEEWREHEILIVPPSFGEGRWMVSINHFHEGYGATAIEAFRAVIKELTP